MLQGLYTTRATNHYPTLSSERSMKGNHNGLRLVVVALFSYLLRPLVKSHDFAELARWAFRDSKKIKLF